MFRDKTNLCSVFAPFYANDGGRTKKRGCWAFVGRNREGEPLISLKTSRQSNSKLVLLIEDDGRETEKEVVLLL